MRGGIREGEYNFQINVYDREWKRNVVSSVTVTVKEINDDAVFSSGSVRFSGKRVFSFLLPHPLQGQMDN